MLITLNGCGGENKESDPDNLPPNKQEPVLDIPVVVHILYRAKEHESNISDAKVHSQITALNNDYRAKNADLAIVPFLFSELVADMEIEFYLTSVDPEGNTTTGITRTLDQTDDAGNIFYTSLGGQDAWPTDRYLNIWVIDNLDRHGNVAIAGKSQSPGGDPLTDGIEVSYKAFGTLPPLQEGLHLGRTATHEIGHWLGLYHLSGPDCTWDDFVKDTPASIYNPNLLTPNETVESCGSIDMTINFMERVEDPYLVMFTHGQKQRVREIFKSDKGRYNFYQNITTVE